MAWQRINGSAERSAAPSRLFLAVSYLVLFVGGVVLGVYGSLLLPVAVSSDTGGTTSSGSGTGTSALHQVVVAAGSSGGVSQLLSVGLLIALVANPLLSVAGLWTAGTRLAAFTPLFGWLIVVLAMASGSSQGDSILPSDLRSVAFLLVGALAFVAVGTLCRPTRGATALPGPAANSPQAAARTAPRAKKLR